MKPYLLLFLAVALGSCANNPAVKNTAAVSAPLVDHSLSVSEYQKLGAPAPSGKWDSTQLVQALKVFTKLKSTLSEALPKTGSPKSGAYFRQMLSACDMSVLNKPGTTDKQRHAVIAAYAPLTEQLASLYMQPESMVNYYSAEDAQLYKLLLENVHQEFVAFDAFIAQHPKLNQHQEFQVKELKYGYHRMVVGVVAALSLSSVYDPSDEEIISEALKSSLQQDAKQLTRSAKTNLRVDMMRIANNQKITEAEKKNIDDALRVINTIH